MTAGIAFLLVPGCFPYSMGAASCGASQCAGTGAASREGQSSIIISQYNMHRDLKKEKLIVFIVVRKKINGSTGMTPELWEVRWS
jgi:hypothetical protein